MRVWGWISNRVARLGMYLRVARYLLRAEAKRAMSRFADSRIRTVLQNLAEFERIAEALATTDWNVLNTVAESQPQFPNRYDPFLGLPWFHTAIEMGSLPVVEWMIGLNADLNHYDAQGFCPLNYATLREDDARAQVLDALILAGASVMSRNDKGKTPLHVAATSNAVFAVDRLLAAGADPNAPDREDTPQTPIQAALSAGYPALADLMRTALSVGQGKSKGQ